MTKDASMEERIELCLEELYKKAQCIIPSKDFKFDYNHFKECAPYIFLNNQPTQHLPRECFMMDSEKQLDIMDKYCKGFEPLWSPTKKVTKKGAAEFERIKVEVEADRSLKKAEKEERLSSAATEYRYVKVYPDALNLVNLLRPYIPLTEKEVKHFKTLTKIYSHIEETWKFIPSHMVTGYRDISKDESCYKLKEFVDWISMDLEMTDIKDISPMDVIAACTLKIFTLNS